MSGPAWTTPKARPEAEAVQEAPYLTHLTRHHGQFTLTAPPNMGRRHSEEPPASEPEAKAKQRRKLKQRKRGIDPSIVSAVVNAGVSASPAPGRATASRPAWASSALPAPMDRVASGSGAPHPRQRAQRSQSENGTQLNPPSPSGGPDGRSRSYARTDVWEGTTCCFLVHTLMPTLQDSMWARTVRQHSRSRSLRPSRSSRRHQHQWCLLLDPACLFRRHLPQDTPSRQLHSRSMPSHRCHRRH